MLIGALTVIAHSQTNTPPTPRSAEYPVMGMTPIDLAAFLNEIKTQMPVGPNIVSVTVKNDGQVTITTINRPIKGPLSGAGETITYSKENGKWIVTERTTWIS